MTETFAEPDIAMDRRPDGTIMLTSRRPLPDWEPSITAVLQKRAELHPDRPLAAHAGATLTYGEAKQRSDALAGAFVELGLGPDKPVMILSGNSIEHLLVSLGAYAAGAPAMPISVAYSLMSKDHARINWRALGEAIESLIEIYCADRTSPADVGRSLATVDEIVSAFTVSGEADAVIRVRVDSIEHLEKLVERLRRDPNIVRTRTLIVLSTLLDRP